MKLKDKFLLAGAATLLMLGISSPKDSTEIARLDADPQTNPNSIQYKIKNKIQITLSQIEEALLHPHENSELLNDANEVFFNIRVGSGILQVKLANDGVYCTFTSDIENVPVTILTPEETISLLNSQDHELINMSYKNLYTPTLEQVEQLNKLLGDHTYIDPNDDPVIIIQKTLITSPIFFKTDHFQDFYLDNITGVDISIGNLNLADGSLKRGIFYSFNSESDSPNALFAIVLNSDGSTKANDITQKDRKAAAEEINKIIGLSPDFLRMPSPDSISDPRKQSA